MKINEKKSDFELIMEAIDSLPSSSCTFKSNPADPKSPIKIVESLIKHTKSCKRQYMFNGKVLNCQANLAKEIFVKLILQKIKGGLLRSCLSHWQFEWIY